MGTIVNYSNGFGNNIMIRGLPLQVAHPGQVFYVNNSGVLPEGGIGASNGNDGSFLMPFSTIDYAIGRCKANAGDIIMCMPGHAETIANATTLFADVAGIAIVSLGQGSLRTTITFGTATSASIPVSADNITFVNVLFKANLAAIVAPFTLTTAKNFTLVNCEFRDNSSILNFKWIVNVGTTSNAADGLTFEDCNFYGLGATAATALVNMAGTNDRVAIKRCYIAHKAVTAAGLMPIATGKIVTNLMCLDNIINLVSATSATTGLIITTDGTTNSGVIARNMIQSLDATTEILVTASSGFIFSQNFYSGAADASGYLLPAADA